MRTQRVAVLGAGVSGLSMIRSLKNKGISVVAFEKTNDIGGVWRSNYLGSGLQVKESLYEFPDFRFNYNKTKKNPFPSTEVVQKYIQDFAAKFSLKDSIVFNSNVTSIKKSSDDKWILTINGKDSDKFDSLVICSGLFSNNPFVPQFQGKSEFETNGGKILHSSEFVSADLVKEKRVVVLGSGKSAYDCLLSAKDAGGSSSMMLFRNSHWTVPHYIAGVVPWEFIFLSRFGQSLVSLYKGVWPTHNSILNKINLSAAVKPVFKIVETVFKTQTDLSKERKITSDFVQDFFYVAQFYNPEVKKRLRSGDVKAKKGEISSLGNKSIILSTGETIPCDVLLCATGFGKSYEIFEEDVRKKLDPQPDGLYLYRQMVPASVPNLYFCGSEASCISNVTSYAIQAEWIANAIANEIQLPTEEQKQKEIDTFKTFKRNWMPFSGQRASQVLAYFIHYHDSLLKDLGINPKRKSNLFAECFAPYTPKDYDGIMLKSKNST